jgi:CDP-diacylglycerol--glycerol-3-phosphate 3-phosphatidyltransferase
MGPEARGAVAVSAWGKWKTAAQMVSLTLLLSTRDGGAFLPGTVLGVAGVAGPVLLVVATYLTVWSLALYMRGLWPYMSR